MGEVELVGRRKELRRGCRFRVRVRDRIEVEVVVRTNTETKSSSLFREKQNRFNLEDTHLEHRINQDPPP